jgi:hypothetical protein
MVRLVTVIGHGVKLLPHFIKHYSRYVDEINIVVYQSDLHPDLHDEVSQYIENQNNVKIVHTLTERIFDWEKVTSLYNFIKSKHKNDWWVVADIDEFHLYPDDDLPKVIQTCEEYGFEMVRGGFIDRIGRGGEFAELVDEVSIWEQFPNAGFFRYPMSSANPNKICLMKGSVEITSGQHYAKIDGQTTWKWQGWNHPQINPIDFVQVHHFKWDRTSIERIKTVAELNEDYAYSNEYFIMFKELIKTKFRINLMEKDFMFELGLIYPKYELYKNWNKLINKIISI